MASPISTVGQLVAVIRAQLSSRASLPVAKQNSAVKKSANAAGTYSADNLEFLLGQRIGSIARDDPKRGRKAFRVFLESVLLSHFGEHLINDPKFYQLVDDIQLSMEADDQISGMVDSAIAHLMSANPERGA